MKSIFCSRFFCVKLLHNISYYFIKFLFRNIFIVYVVEEEYAYNGNSNK